MNSDNTVISVISAIMIFSAIMTVLVKSSIGKTFMYYILWLNVILMLVTHGSQIADMLKPLGNIK